jgi:hypothetical protein
MRTSVGAEFMEPRDMAYWGCPWLPRERIAELKRAVDRTSLIWSWRRNHIGINTAAQRAMITK